MGPYILALLPGHKKKRPQDLMSAKTTITTGETRLGRVTFASGSTDLGTTMTISYELRKRSVFKILVRPRTHLDTGDARTEMDTDDRKDTR